MSTSLDAIVFLASWMYVSLAPYTKVEESFNLHATHDVLMYGVQRESLNHYDHFVFPGAVPRTFIGSVLLAWISRIALAIASKLTPFHDKVDIQVMVRLMLAGFNASGLCLLRRAISRRFGGPTSVLFVILTLTQFHLLFWMGRTLPNMFALIPANLALYMLVDRAPNSTRPSKENVHRAIGLLTFASVVFRAELALLVGPLAVQAIVRQYTSIANVVKVGLLTGTVSVVATVLVDSYFWQRWPLWPELYGVYFNVLDGKSAEWGVSPYHTYFSAHLPKLLLSAAPLSALGALLDSRIRSLLAPYLTFILLISALGHKEWRFIIYMVPAFNIGAARGATWLVTRPKNSLFGRLSFLTLVALIAVNCFATFLFARSSFANYPGGAALYAFNRMFASEDNVHVHISNLAAQTGASLFLHSNAPPFLPGFDAGHPTNWVYNKTENLSLRALTASKQITHLIAEIPALDSAVMDSWSPVAVVDGFDGWRLDRHVGQAFKTGVGDGLKALGNALVMLRSEKLVILRRKS
ncbi:glycosyltransferase family 22 protein [Trametes coccinea BRFM310]|uniref:Mannosyltransferase n=1 Tax=Trametes coccinea (strain BRFM310) TaxID=1353009 RepID=A0A1Y2I9A7_TRAC3|nr:glycosyltransferase family 22 protein [Trametes coccinea BRFM310]